MSVHPEVERLLTAKYDDTDLTLMDMAMIGQSLLNSISTTVTLGHTRPGHTLDYSQPRNDLWLGVVQDFIIWTSGRTKFNPSAQERLTAFIQESGWQRHCLNEASKLLGLDALQAGPTKRRSA